MSLLMLGLAVLALLGWTRLARLQALVDELAARVHALEGAPKRRPNPVAPDQRPDLDPAPRPPIPTTPPIVRAPSAPTAPGVRVPSPATPEPAPDLIAAIVRAVTSPTASTVSTSLETRIGARWLLYIGVIAIVVGVAYFEKLAIDNHWIGETARTVEGGIVGLVLVYAGIRFARTGRALFGQIISGGGVAVLYVSAYAAFDMYALISRPAAFLLMCAITTLAAWLADRQRSQGLALMAVGGGFATPFMLPSNVDAQTTLFTYDAILIAGTMYLAHRGEWPVLNAASYGFTVFTVNGWAERFYAPSKYLATELFITLFCAMYLYILRETRRAGATKIDLARGVLLSAPAVYYVASLAILSEHSMALLVFLILLALVGAIAAASLGSIARVVFWVLVAAPLLVWSDDHASRTWLVAGLTTVAAVHTIFLLAHLQWTRRSDASLAPADIVLLHLNPLWAYGCAYLLLEGTYPDAAASVAAAFALCHGVLAHVLARRDREHGLHAIAIAFTLLAVAVALQFKGAWVTAGWAAEGAAVVALGLRERRDWLRAAGAGLFAVAAGRLLQLQFAPTELNHLVLLNARTACGVFVITMAYWLGWLHRREDTTKHSPEVAVFVVGAQVLTVTTISSEINAYWDVRTLETFSSLARGLMLSMAWALYATGLIVVGIRRRYAPIRWVAMALFGLTIVKVFAIDLAELDRIYRVASIIGLGLMLLTTSYLYQRFRVNSPSSSDHRQPHGL